MADSPLCGDVWTVVLDRVRGYEQGGRRPALVVSIDEFNDGPAGLVVVLPLTTTLRRLPFRVPLEPPEAGVIQPSSIMVEQPRTVARERFGPRWGAVTGETMQRVERALRALLVL
jgi:mRNA interferase MazF